MRLNVKKIKREIEDQGISVYDLAQKMKAREQWIYMILNGQGGRTFKTLERFAKALGLNEKELIE